LVDGKATGTEKLTRLTEEFSDDDCPWLPNATMPVATPMPPLVPFSVAIVSAMSN